MESTQNIHPPEVGGVPFRHNTPLNVVCKSVTILFSNIGEFTMKRQKTKEWIKQYLLLNINETPTGCWEWDGYKNKGYGRWYVNGTAWPTHRLSWTVFIGEIPDGLSLLHKCDNLACIKTSHLYVGTHKENMRDISERTVFKWRPKGWNDYCGNGSMPQKDRKKPICGT